MLIRNVQVLCFSKKKQLRFDEMENITFKNNELWFVRVSCGRHELIKNFKAWGNDMRRLIFIYEK